MTPFKLFRYLKNIDLHALTAREVLYRYHDLPEIKSLKRYDFFEFNMTQTVDDDKLFFESFLADSYQFINPTKHAYYLSYMKKLRPHSNFFLLKVSSLDLSLSQKQINTNKHGSVYVTQHLLWEICIDKCYGSYIDIQNQLSQHIVESQSREKGLLVNPLFEKGNWCEIDEYYQ